MNVTLKRCPSCGEPIRVFKHDDMAQCDNTRCDELYRVIRDGDDLTLRHVYFKQRPATETRLDMFLRGVMHPEVSE